MASAAPVSSDDLSAPLLPPSGGDRRGNSLTRRLPSLRGAARLLRRSSSRLLLREPSAVVRETAAEHLERRQGDWAYSTPVVSLDIGWNIALIGLSLVVLVLSRYELPAYPLRFWVAGYVLQCAVHMACVWVEYQRRRQQRQPSLRNGRVGNFDGSTSSDNGDVSSGEQSAGRDDEFSFTRHLESVNTMFSFIWWIFGFYWVSAGGDDLVHDAPQLYWLCIVFLGIDVLVVVFCVALACIIGLAICCCLPCIITILYATTKQVEGAHAEQIDRLTKYRFRKMDEMEKQMAGFVTPVGGLMLEVGSNPPIEHVLPAEDAECSICLLSYEDDVELRQLPCGHHFHCACIDKWLHLNAMCPLCRFNVLHGYQQEAEVDAAA